MHVKLANGQARHKCSWLLLDPGSSNRLGEATALLLAERGAQVVLGSRREDRLAALEKRIREGGGQAAYATTDVKRRADVSNLVQVACEQFGKLDVLINNAGIAPISLLDELRVEDWEEMIDVNLRGFLYGIAAALPIFRKQGFGHFVNIVSTAGLRIVPLQAVYAGTKNAVRTISEGLRQEAGDALRVAICWSDSYQFFSDDATSLSARSSLLPCR